jgi:hypothetical protein
MPSLSSSLSPGRRMGKSCGTCADIVVDLTETAVLGDILRRFAADSIAQVVIFPMLEAHLALELSNRWSRMGIGPHLLFRRLLCTLVCNNRCDSATGAPGRRVDYRAPPKRAMGPPGSSMAVPSRGRSICLFHVTD